MIQSDLWSRFGSLDQVNLTGIDELGFCGSISFGSGNMDIALDTVSLVALTSDTRVSIQAGDAQILNSSGITYDNGNPYPDNYNGNDGQFSLTAKHIDIGNGDTWLSGYQRVDLTARKILPLQGRAL